ncbi:uncharacterized protein LOC109611485 isoform X1 [Ooceraea biroi]|uniref:uncharacterized protein LOC109611485 isoform X1 n=1 Tax=Ooceraea biroi TaxID=2015173 RepID=UPI000F0936CC|nr:uncharacterized protein LOC109611485 isoform X1 [Ooceraea biroi]
MHTVIGIIFILLTNSTTINFSRFFKAECRIDNALRLLSSVTFYSTHAIMFISFWINTNNTKYFLDQLQHIYDELKDKNEIAIYEKYGYFGKRLTIILIVLSTCTAFGNSIILCLPYILDIVMPKNESYGIYIMEIMTKYFIVSEKYYYLIFTYLNISCSAGIIAYVATTTMFISFFKHICGMFEIASYRIEQVMAIELLLDINTKNEILIYKKLIYAVDIHRKAMEFAKYCLNKLEGSMLVFLIATVLCLSFNLFRIFHIESPTEKVEEVLLHFTAVAFIMVALFVPNNIGQEITDHSNSVYVTSYNVS